MSGSGLAIQHWQEKRGHSPFLIDSSVRAEDCVRTITARSWPVPCPHPFPYNTALDQADLKT